MNTPVGNVMPKFDIAPPIRRTVEIELPTAGDLWDEGAEKNRAEAVAPIVNPEAPGVDAESSSDVRLVSDETPAVEPASTDVPMVNPDAGAADLSAVQPPAVTQPSETGAVTMAVPAAHAAEALSDAEAPTEATTSGRQAFSEDETIKLLMDLASLQEDLERAREQTNSARRHVEIVQEQLAKTVTEKTVVQEQLQRLMAEFDNYRRRVEREKVEAVERGKQTVILNLLEVLDNFDRALATGRTEGGNLADFLAGVELIQRQLADGLASVGVKPISAIGQPFDPTVHEAIATDETDEYKPNTVLAELKRGYMLGDRLLRPAMVRVAVRPTSA